MKLNIYVVGIKVTILNFKHLYYNKIQNYVDT